MLMDVKAVSCAATSHHAVNISPHAVTKDALPYFTLDLVSPLMSTASDEAQGPLLQHHVLCRRESDCTFACLHVKVSPP